VADLDVVLPGRRFLNRTVQSRPVDDEETGCIVSNEKTVTLAAANGFLSNWTATEKVLATSLKYVEVAYEQATATARKEEINRGDGSNSAHYVRVTLNHPWHMASLASHTSYITAGERYRPLGGLSACRRSEIQKTRSQAK
jgi:hypothetical protein